MPPLPLRTGRDGPARSKQVEGGRRCEGEAVGPRRQLPERPTHGRTVAQSHSGGSRRQQAVRLPVQAGL
eukprot:COSAG01_NODE_7319_length_3253_cov_194.192137_2_plen_69_part_00